MDFDQLLKNCESEILNDTDFEDPRDWVAAIKRRVYVNVESTRTIEALPSEITDKH